MTQTQIINEITQLSLAEKIRVVELILRDIRQESESQKPSLAQSAGLLVEDYQKGGDLTAFTALDGEDFYESR